MVFQFDLVCSDQWKTPLTSTIYLLGMFVGSLISGPLSDRYRHDEIFKLHEAFQSGAVEMSENCRLKSATEQPV